MAVTFSIEIQAPPERVFDYVSNVTRHPEWANAKASMKMEQVGGSEPGPGARYRSEGVFVKSDVSADISVTAYERPSRFAIRSDQHQEGKKDVWYVNDYALRARNGGTTISKTVTSNGNPLIFYVAYPAIRSDAMTSLRNLKAKVEAGA